MTRIEIRPASADRFDDAHHAITGGGDGRSCQCQWWTLTNAEFRESTVDERRELWRDEMSARVPPGLVAYVDEEPAGWVRVGPRPPQKRLARTKEFVAGTREPWHDQRVWAVTCFVVRREHRHAGLMQHLLDAAVDFAREHGARVVEGYPRDPSARSIPTNDLYRGVLSVFESAGFEIVARQKPDRATVALQLQP